MWRKKIGLALSGGAARALSHIGVLEVLEDLGVEISAVSGTSMGAIIGACYCSGISLKELKDYVNSLDWKSFLLFTDVTITKMGIVDGKNVEKVLHDFLGDKTFNICSKKFCCVAVDIVSRKKVIINEGKLKDAVRASISIPGFFQPVCTDDMILVDGGVIEPLPTEAIKMLGVNFIIGSSIAFRKEEEVESIKNKSYIYRPSGYKNSTKGEKAEEKKSWLDTLRKREEDKHKYKKLSVNTILDISFNIMHREMTEKYLKKADILIEPIVGDFGFFDFIHGKEIIERGRKAAIEKIPEIKKKLRL